MQRRRAAISRANQYQALPLRFFISSGQGESLGTRLALLCKCTVHTYHILSNRHHAQLQFIIFFAVHFDVATVCGWCVATEMSSKTNSPIAL